jgi:hypothetical protein
VNDLTDVLACLARLLKPGGLLAVGFSPLYYSPKGDHGRFDLPIPWLHAFLPERWVLRWASMKKGRAIASASDVGLNKLTPRQFREYVNNPQWSIRVIRYNRGKQWFMRVARIIRHLPLVERYFTINIYAILVRTEADHSI